MRINRIIAGAMAAVVVISLIVAAVVYQHRAAKREELQRYQARVLHLEGIATQADLSIREARASGDPRTIITAQQSARYLTSDEEAELAELHRRIAAMEIDGIGK